MTAQVELVTLAHNVDHYPDGILRIITRDGLYMISPPLAEAKMRRGNFRDGRIGNVLEIWAHIVNESGIDVLGGKLSCWCSPREGRKIIKKLRKFVY